MTQLTNSQCDGTQIEADEPIEPVDMDVGVDPVLVSPEMTVVEEEKNEKHDEASEKQENEGDHKEAKKKRLEDDRQLVPYDWSRQCSKHLSHIETRLMEQEYMSHEVVRQLMLLIESWNPFPRGDYGWLLRRTMDIGVRHLRQLVRYYLRSGAGLETFAKEAMQVVRLLFEEAWHRLLIGAKKPGMRPALCGIVATMRDFEVDTIGSAACEFGFFWTFSVGAMSRIAEKVGRYATTSVEDMPSWGSVMTQPLFRIEVSSLMLVRVQPSSVKMSSREIKAVFEAKGKPLTEAELEKLVGVEGPSLFEACFPDEKDW